MRICVALLLLSLLLASLGCSPSSGGTNTASEINENHAVNAVVEGRAPTVSSANSNVPSAGNVNPITDTAAALKPQTRPAPDDSEFFTTMDKSGMPVETRSFHNNPQLIKVTRTWKSPTDKTIEIYLKNGKIVKLPGDQIREINSVPASVFLDAAGVKPSPPPPVDPAAREKKLDAQKHIN